MATVVSQKAQRIARALDPERPATCRVQLYFMRPGEAASWIAKGMYQRQRPLRQYHVAFLAHLMQTGKFRDGTPIDFAMVDRVQWCVNGQHTLHAIVQSECGQWVTLTIHAVETLDDIPPLYNTYDRQLPRNAKDLLMAYGFPEQHQMSSRHAMMLIAGVRFVLSGLVYPMPNRDVRLGYLRDQELLYVAAMQWAKEAGMLFACMKGAQTAWGRYLFRQPFVAVGIVLMRYQPEKAMMFWEMVSDESHINPLHPTRLLAKWAQREGIRGNYNRMDYVRIAASAWNAFYEDRQLRQLVMQDAGNPVHLLGTPHTSSTVRRYVNPEWDLLTEPMPYAEPLYER